MMGMVVTAACALAFASSGKLFLVGGGRTPAEIPKRFIAECGGPDAAIIVIPLVSAEPESSTGSEEFLRENGAKNVWTFRVARPNAAQRHELAMRLKSAQGIWIPGGVQGRFVSRLGKAWIDAHIRPAVARGTHYYGTSAGAMLASDPMIEGPGEELETSRTGRGIGLTTWLIDTHFRERTREGRLWDAMLKTQQPNGIGLSEGEWVVIQRDVILERHGVPLVVQLEPDFVPNKATSAWAWSNIAAWSWPTPGASTNRHWQSQPR